MLICCQPCFHAGRGEQEDSPGPEDGFGGSAVGGEERGGEEERAPAAVHQRQMCMGSGEGRAQMQDCTGNSGKDAKMVIYLLWPVFNFSVFSRVPLCVHAWSPAWCKLGLPLCHPHDRVISHPGIHPTQLRRNICTLETSFVFPTRSDTDSLPGSEIKL